MKTPNANPPNLTRELLARGAGLFLVLCYPLLGMAWHHGYPLWSVEMLLLVGGIAVFALLLAWLLRPVRAIVANLVVVCLLTLAFMVQFNPLFPGIMAILAVGGLTGVALGRHFPGALLVVMCALLVGAFGDNWMDRIRHAPTVAGPAGEATTGPVIHLLVDGFIGPGGLPAENETGGLKTELLAFFREFGFELYGNAYTHYASTLDSMTRAMNFRNDDANLFRRLTMLREPLAVRENAWFQALDALGYPVSVYQTEAFDFCTGKPLAEGRCHVTAVPQLETVHTAVRDVPTRIAVLLRTLLRQSNVLNDLLLKFTGQWGVANYNPDTLERLISDVRAAPNRAYFAHLLIPHQPMVFRPDCSLNYESEPWQRFAAFDGLIGNSEDTRRPRYLNYADNARCALLQLANVFNALRDMGLYDAATLIVHGDHGGPLYEYGPFTQNSGRLSTRDLREIYSTLFAVKFPGGAFEVRDEIVALNVLMARTLSRLAEKPVQDLGLAVWREDSPFVYLTDTDPLTRVDIDFFER